MRDNNGHILSETRSGNGNMCVKRHCLVRKEELKDPFDTEEKFISRVFDEGVNSRDTEEIRYTPVQENGNVPRSV